MRSPAPGQRRAAFAAIAAIAALSGASPVAGQQPTTTSPPAARLEDPLRLGEFGAYTDPARAQAMVQQCEANTRETTTRVTTFLKTMQVFARDHDEYHQRLDEVNKAGQALQDAEKRLASLSGAEADRFAADVVTARRERYRKLAEELPTHTQRFDFTAGMARRQALETIAFLKKIGVSDAEMSRSSGPEVIRNQEERCRRIKAWAALGARGQTTPH